MHVWDFPEAQFWNASIMKNLCSALFPAAETLWADEKKSGAAAEGVGWQVEGVWERESFVGGAMGGEEAFLRESERVSEQFSYQLSIYTCSYCFNKFIYELFL